MGRRVLVTGLGTFWGGRVAQALEARPRRRGDHRARHRRAARSSSSAPSTSAADENYSILSRIVQATKVDTIVHTFLVVDSHADVGAARMHEINVIGTMNLFAAASAPGSTVRNVVVKSSALVYGASPQDPVWFREDDAAHGTRRAPRVERSLLEVEGYVRDFAEDNPHVDGHAAAVLQRARPRHRHAAQPRP